MSTSLTATSNLAFDTSSTGLPETTVEALVSRCTPVSYLLMATNDGENRRKTVDRSTIFVTCDVLNRRSSSSDSSRKVAMAVYFGAESDLNTQFAKSFSKKAACDERVILYTLQHTYDTFEKTQASDLTEIRTIVIGTHKKHLFDNIAHRLPKYKANGWKIRAGQKREPAHVGIYKSIDSIIADFASEKNIAIKFWRITAVENTQAREDADAAVADR